MVRKICLHCDMGFLAQSWQVKNGFGKYCSRDCARTARRGKPTKKGLGYTQRACLYCGKEFRLRRYRIEVEGRGKYCSRSCAGKARRGLNIGGRVRLDKLIQCKYCGKDFIAQGSKAARTVKYCSVQCVSACPERRRRRIKGVSAAWRRGAYDGVFQSPTNIERQVTAALDILGIEHQSQFRPENYNRVFDEYIPPSILLEVNGDYWHSLPHKKESDKEKAKWAKNNGFNLLTIWEHEIEERGAWSLIIERVYSLLKGS